MKSADPAAREIDLLSKISQTARLLASQPELLATARRNLRADMARSPLCDHPGHARAIEQAYRAVWQIRCAQP